MKRILVATGLSLGVLWQLNCSSSSAPGTSGESADSGGTDSGGTDASSLSKNRCLPPNPSGPEFYPPSSLPSGSCTGDQSCQIGIDPCCAQASGDEIDGYECTCSSGTWQCMDVYQGDSICPGPREPNCGDAGANLDGG